MLFLLRSVRRKAVLHERTLVTFLPPNSLRFEYVASVTYGSTRATGAMGGGVLPGAIVTIQTCCVLSRKTDPNGMYTDYTY